jgi:hypothetical protein
MFGSMSDDFDRLDDDALLGYLTGAAVERDERLVIEERWTVGVRMRPGVRDGEWFAEARSGEAVILGVNGPDRRTAMLRLAHLFADAPVIGSPRKARVGKSVGKNPNPLEAGQPKPLD